MSNTEILLTNEECDMFKPIGALIAFESENNSMNHSCYLELRPIRKDGTFGAAKPVSRKFMQDILSSFSEEYRSTPHGTIPPNMLYADCRKGKETYIWYNPPGIRYRYFSESLGLKNDKYHVPGTIYVVKGNELYIYCFKGKKPSMTDILLGVPYFNVYNTGLVCMGSAKAIIPDKKGLTYKEVIDAWENAFWNSYDVHTNGSPSTKMNLVETIAKYKDKPFDTKELVTRPDRLTLQTIISKLD